MGIIILLTCNQLIYRIQGKTTQLCSSFLECSDFRLQLYVYIYVLISFFILLHNYHVCAVLDITKYKQNVSTFVAETFESTENSVN